MLLSFAAAGAQTHEHGDPNEGFVPIPAKPDRSKGVFWLTELDLRADSLYHHPESGEKFTGEAWTSSSANEPAIVTLKEGYSAGMFRGYYDQRRTQLKYETMQVGGKKEGAYTHYYENGAVNFRATNKNDKLYGKRYCFYENGRRQHIHTYKKGGIETGRYEEWTADGITYITTHNKKGEHHGAVRQYNNGKVRVQARYRDGKLHGSFRQYFSPGKLEVRGHYTNGKRDGKWSFYNDDGTLKRTNAYKNGKLLNTKK